MPGTVYTVASGKGGVGKTTTSVNLAVALWRAGNAVALVDADIGMANLAAVLDLEPEETLHDVLAGRATVEEAVIEAKDGDLMVLPGSRSLESFADANPNALLAAVGDLADRADYVIVDTGAGLSYEDVLPLGMADGVVLVTTPDPAAFGDTMKTMEIADLLNAPIRGLVVTRAVPDTDSAAIAAEIGAEPLGTIPEDPAVMASTVAGDPLESHAPDSEAAAAYRDLADTLLSGDEAWLEAHPRERVYDRGPTDEPDVAAGEEVSNGSGPAPVTDEADAEEDEPASPSPEAEGGTEPDGAEDGAAAVGDESDEVAAEPAADEEAPETDVDVSGTEGDGPDTDADESEVDAAEPTPDADQDVAGDAVAGDEVADETEGGESPDSDLDPGEPAADEDEPKTFPAGGVQREGRTADVADDEEPGDAEDDGMAGDESDDPDGDTDEDERGADEGGADEGVDQVADEGEERGEDAASAEEEKRGGFFGWIGRLFS